MTSRTNGHTKRNKKKLMKTPSEYRDKVGTSAISAASTGREMPISVPLESPKRFAKYIAKEKANAPSAGEEGFMLCGSFRFSVPRM